MDGLGQPTYKYNQACLPITSNSSQSADSNKAIATSASHTEWNIAMKILSSPLLRCIAYFWGHELNDNNSVNFTSSSM